MRKIEIILREDLGNMKEWIKDGNNYELHFYTTDQCSDKDKNITILTIYQNEQHPEVWSYTSENHNIDMGHGFIKTDYLDYKYSDEVNLQKAKELFEKMVAEYCEDQLYFYEEMFKDFRVD